MEPVTHLMYGACLARAGFNRKTLLATPVMVLAAEIPDLDIFTEIRGPVYGFQHHRGFTHTFLGIPFDAAAALLIVYAVRRFRQARKQVRKKDELRTEPGLAPRWGVLFGLACLAALSHILLDFTNSYGVRPLMPFSYRWHHWDIVSVIEPVMWAILFLALTLPALFVLIQEEIGARRKGPRGRFAAIVALVLIALLWGVRDFEHRRALAALDAMDYGGELPVRFSAYATAVNIFAWNAVVETDSGYRIMPVNSLTPEVDPHRQAHFFYKPPSTPVIEAARQSYLGRVFLDWADFPVFEVRPLAAGEEVPEQSSARSSQPATTLLPASWNQQPSLQPQEQPEQPQAPAPRGYSVRIFDLRYYDVESMLRGRRRVLGATVQLDRDLRPVAYYMASFFGRSVQRVRSAE